MGHQEANRRVPSTVAHAQQCPEQTEAVAGELSPQNQVLQDQGGENPEVLTPKLKDEQESEREVAGIVPATGTRVCLIWEPRVVCSGPWRLVNSSRTLHTRVKELLVLFVRGRDLGISAEGAVYTQGSIAKEQLHPAFLIALQARSATLPPSSLRVSQEHGGGSQSLCFGISTGSLGLHVKVNTQDPKGQEDKGMTLNFERSCTPPHSGVVSETCREGGWI